MPQRTPTPDVHTTPPDTHVAPAADASVAVAAPHEDPPAPGPARDVHLPEIRRARLPNGLEVNHVEYHTLPVLHLRLAVRAGLAADPANLPGLSSFTGDMLNEGTRAHTSAQLAEAIEFVGGALDITTSNDTTTVSVVVLKDHAETALSLLAEVIADPTFPQTEIEKLRRRELDRLERSQNDPGWLSRRAYNQALYGAQHPYAHVDTTPEALRRMTRNDLVAFHRARYVAGNMSLVAVGDITAADLDRLLGRTLGRVRAGTVPAVQLPDPPALAARQVILVDRPGSQQSVVRIGNATLRRADDDYVPFSVTNHVLGGGAASRLFMDLREIRSLTYGAYARQTDTLGRGNWFVGGSVRTPATGDALHAFMRHVECMTTDAPPDPEMAQGRSYLIDSFPLSIETPGNIADLITGLRVYGLSDDYYDRYRSRVGQVDGATVLQLAQRYIHPDHALVVVVGTADAPVQVGPACAALASLPAEASFGQQVAACATPHEGDAPRQTQPLQEVLRGFGPVRVVNLRGETVRELTATEPSATPLRARCADLATPALQQLSHHEPAGR
ncbi:MAG: pitrilysin family protein [Polyangiales bacterium]